MSHCVRIRFLCSWQPFDAYLLVMLVFYNVWKVSRGVWIFPHLILSEPWGTSQPFKDTPTTILRTTMGKRACVCESWYENCSIHHQPYKYKSSPFPIQDVSKDVVTMIQHFHVSHQKLLKIDHTHFRESKVLRAWLSSLAWTLSCTLEYIELYLLRRHLRMAGMRMLVFLHFNRGCGWIEHTFFSESLNAFHSSINKLVTVLRSPTPFKSPDAYRSFMKAIIAINGFLGWRSSGIKRYFLVFVRFLRRRRALLAVLISSGVCDSTHFFRAIALAVLFWLAVWLYAYYQY